jgi:hypothetical protein
MTDERWYVVPARRDWLYVLFILPDGTTLKVYAP